MVNPIRPHWAPEAHRQIATLRGPENSVGEQLLLDAPRELFVSVAWLLRSCLV